MKSFIKEKLFSGINYLEEINSQDNKEYKKLMKEMIDLINKLKNNLTDEEKKEILWKLNLAQCGLEAETANTYFIEGFKLGLATAAEAFSGL